MDLNADVGEDVGDDDALLAIVTSANVACGFHAGGPATMARVAARAAERGVVIGAQVSYADRAGFGRRGLDVAPGELTAGVLYQLGALDALCRAAGTRVRYVKPHGALYNRIARDAEQAGAVVAAITAYDRSLPLLTLPDSVAAEVAGAAGLTALGEGFADRAYTADGRLRPRSEPGAVLTDPAAVTAQAVTLARSGEVASICVHGDTPGAVGLARAVHAALAGAGLPPAAFC